MKRFIVSLLLFVLCIKGWSIDFYGVYPTNWWVGMKNQNLQLLFRGEQVGRFTKVIIKYPGIKVKNVFRLESDNSLFADIVISKSAKPGKFRIILSGGGLPDEDVSYELRSRSPENGTRRVQGVTSKDFTYLLMPDRFSNGNPSNDNIEDYRDKQSDRTNKFARHGGDLKGIKNHLDYFKELGITTIWLTPVVENDMPVQREAGFEMSGYHGYWITDHYKVDRRFGTNEEYKEFINAAHNKGLKIIQDAIYNHVGSYHWINLDPPAKDWINQWPQYTGTNHREEILIDPYVSEIDKTLMLKGWFVPQLPDLNLDNSFLATYMIQQAIWSVEEFGFDGFRIDTYKYCEESFVNRLNATLLEEFPSITTFVEAWSNTVVANAYFVQNNIDFPFKHNAQGAIDFSLCFAMHDGMIQPSGGLTGVNRIYMTLAQDLVYKNPMNNCIFLDNHDMDRVYSKIGEDWNKMKWGFNWLLTLRGIPQIYYGTELLMKNLKNPTDAEVRHDFPGGWNEDAENKFIASGRTDTENMAFNYLKKLAQFRSSSSAITTGNTMQYVVNNGVYVYFRYDDKQTVMVITNSGNKNFKPDWEYYKERTGDFTKMKNVISDQVLSMQGFSIDPGESFVFELIR